MATPDLASLQAAMDAEWALLRSSMDAVQGRQVELLQQAWGRLPVSKSEGEASPKALDTEVQVETSSRPVASTHSTGQALLASRVALGQHSDLFGSLPEISRIDELQDWLGEKVDTDNSLKARVRIFFLDWIHWFSHLQEPERTGWLACFVDGIFEQIAALVIFFNVVFMVVTTDRAMRLMVGGKVEQATQSRQEQIEMSFVIFYAVELAARIMVHRVYFFIGQNCGWNCFDAFLVGLSVQDVVASVMAKSNGANVAFLRLLRSFKLAKILRVARVLQVFKELRMILNSLAGSVRSLFWSLLMMAFIYFAFSLLFVQITARYLTDYGADLDDEAVDNILQSFGSVSTGMFTLFSGSTGADWTVPYNHVKQIGLFMELCYLLFIAFINISFMNIVTGLFIERALKLAQPDLEAQALQEYREELSCAADMRRVANECLDTDHDGVLSPSEVVTFVRHPVMRAKFSVLGVTIKDVEMFYGMLSSASDRPDGGVPLEHFVQGCLRLRGTASSIDLQMLVFRLVMMEQHHRDFEKKVNFSQEQILRVANRLEWAQQNTTPESLRDPKASKELNKEGLLGQLSI